MLKPCWPGYPFSLDHLADLSDEPGLFLLVSERSLYVLQNAVINQLMDQSAYAEEVLGEYYVPTRPDLDNYELFLSVAQDLQRDTMEVEHMFYGIEEAILLRDVYGVPGSGDVTRTLGPVPAGEIWEVQGASAVCVGSAPTYFVFIANDGAYNFNLEFVGSPGASVVCTWLGRLILSEGHSVKILYGSPTQQSTLTSELWYAKLL